MTLRMRLALIFVMVFLIFPADHVQARPGGGSAGRASSGSRSTSSGSRSSSSRPSNPKSAAGKTASGRTIAPARTISRTYIVSGPSYRPAVLVGYYDPIVHVYPVASMYYGVPYYPYYLYYDYDEDRNVGGIIFMVCLLLLVLFVVGCVVL